MGETSQIRPRGAAGIGTALLQARDHVRRLQAWLTGPPGVAEGPRRLTLVIAALGAIVVGIWIVASPGVSGDGEVTIWTPGVLMLQTVDGLIDTGPGPAPVIVRTAGAVLLATAVATDVLLAFLATLWASRALYRLCGWIAAGFRADLETRVARALDTTRIDDQRQGSVH